MKKAEGKKLIHLKSDVGGEVYDVLDHQKDKLVGPGANYTWTSSGGKNDKTGAILLWAHDEKARVFGKDNNAVQKDKASGTEGEYI